jgi:hypothetical protein
VPRSAKEEGSGAVEGISEKSSSKLEICPLPAPDDVGGTNMRTSFKTDRLLVGATDP